jgi:hypothetical protein
VRGKGFWGASGIMSLLSASLFIIILAGGSLSFGQAADVDNAPQLQTREEFSLDLPKISSCVDQETNEFSGVRITYPDDENQIVIGTGDDMEIKNSSSGREKTLHREPPEKTGFLSKFEVKQIIKVNKYFISGLETYEKLLQKKSWPRLLYFDAYFPHFMNGYYYLLCAARNSESALPLGARIPEEEFDVSLNSPKTDVRINRWREAQDTIIKLRITSKELAHQIKLLQDNLGKVKDNEDIDTPRELENTLVAFVRIYFNLRPPSPVVLKKNRY